MDQIQDARLAALELLVGTLAAQLEDVPGYDAEAVHAAIKAERQVDVQAEARRILSTPGVER